MSTSRNIFLTISLPEQNIEKVLADHKLYDFTISKKFLLIGVGDKNFSLDESDQLIMKYSSSAERFARQMFESIVEYYVSQGVPLIAVGSGLGKNDLRYYKNIDPAFGYKIYIVDFIAPELEKLSDNELIDKLEPKVKRAYSRKKLEDYLHRYHTVDWEDLGWEVLQPRTFFDLLTFPLDAKPFYHHSEPEELLVIGDVHGDYDDLIEILDAHPKADVTLLGDYIDKGPQSGKVIRLLLKRHENLHLLSGNHEINLRKKYIERRTTFGRLEQDTVNQLAEEDIGENEIRTFLSYLGTYRTIHYADRNFILSHAGMEPSLTSKLAVDGGIDLIPSEVFLYGIKKVGETSYDREIDGQWANHPMKNTVMIHGHRNKFEVVAAGEKLNSSFAINLADSDNTTLRYIVINPDRTTEIHVRKRFTNEEKIFPFDL